MIHVMLMSLMYVAVNEIVGIMSELEVEVANAFAESKFGLLLCCADVVNLPEYLIVSSGG
jgi:hypothetical protein